MKYCAIALLLLCHTLVYSQRTDFARTDFCTADSIAAHYTAHPLTNLKMLAEKLTVPLTTEQEKFRAIYKWVCSNIEADYALLILNKRNRARLKGDKLKEWSIRYNKMVFDTLRYKSKTVCTGYAYLVKELAYHAGLSCEIINGYARHAGIGRQAPEAVNHSWNKIQLNSKWYVCDATWSSGVFNLSKGEFIKKYNDAFFLMTPEEFALTHDDRMQDP